MQTRAHPVAFVLCYIYTTSCPGSGVVTYQLPQGREAQYVCSTRYSAISLGQACTLKSPSR